MGLKKRSKAKPKAKKPRQERPKKRAGDTYSISMALPNAGYTVSTEEYDKLCDHAHGILGSFLAAEERIMEDSLLMHALAHALEIAQTHYEGSTLLLNATIELNIDMITRINAVERTQPLLGGTAWVKAADIQKAIEGPQIDANEQQRPLSPRGEQFGL